MGQTISSMLWAAPEPAQQLEKPKEVTTETKEVTTETTELTQQQDEVKTYTADMLLNKIQTEKKYAMINEIMNFIKTNDIHAYLFGSATWRIMFDEQDGHDFDIAILTDSKHLHHMEKLLRFCEKNSFKLEKVISHVDADDYFFPGGKYDAYRYEATKENIKLDLSFVSSLDNFVNNMEDFDCGMLLYNINTNRYFVRSFYKRVEAIVDDTSYYTNEYYQPKEEDVIAEIFENCKKKKLTLKIVGKKSEVRSSFARIMKAIEYGFTYDINEIYFSVCDLFRSSFCIPDKNSIETYPKYQRTFAEKYIDSPVAYDLVKQCFGKLKNRSIYSSRLKNYELIRNVSAYALWNKDVVYVMQLLQYYNKGYIFSGERLILRVLFEKYTPEFYIEFAISIGKELRAKDENLYKHYMRIISEEAIAAKKMDVYYKLVELDKNSYERPRDAIVRIIMEKWESSEMFNSDGITESEFETRIKNMDDYVLAGYVLVKPELAERIDAITRNKLHEKFCFAMDKALLIKDSVTINDIGRYIINISDEKVNAYFERYFKSDHNMMIYCDVHRFLPYMLSKKKRSVVNFYFFLHKGTENVNIAYEFSKYDGDIKSFIEDAEAYIAKYGDCGMNIKLKQMKASFMDPDVVKDRVYAEYALSFMEKY